MNIEIALWLTTFVVVIKPKTIIKPRSPTGKRLEGSAEDWTLYAL